MKTKTVWSLSCSHFWDRATSHVVMYLCQELAGFLCYSGIMWMQNKHVSFMVWYKILTLVPPNFCFFHFIHRKREQLPNLNQHNYKNWNLNEYLGKAQVLKDTKVSLRKHHRQQLSTQELQNNGLVRSCSRDKYVYLDTNCSSKLSEG